MKHIFLVNPAAGKGRASTVVLPEIIRTVKEMGLEYEIHRTIGPGDAQRFASSVCEQYAGKPLRVYACGGDGTLNETLNGVHGHSGVELAVVPAGTGNDFVRNFSEPKAFLNIRKQIEGEAIPVDTMEYTLDGSDENRYALNMFNIGFDSEVVAKAAELKEKPFISGPIAYAAGVGIIFAKKKTVDIRVRYDGGDEQKYKALLIAAANGCFCGGGFKGVPMSILDDGLLDVSIVREVSRMKFLSLVWKYHEGTHLSDKRAEDIILYKKCKEVLISSENLLKIAIDGEILSAKSIDMHVCENAINLSIPKGCEKMKGN